MIKIYLKKIYITNTSIFFYWSGQYRSAGKYGMLKVINFQFR